MTEKILLLPFGWFHMYSFEFGCLAKFSHDDYGFLHIVKDFTTNYYGKHSSTHSIPQAQPFTCSTSATSDSDDGPQTKTTSLSANTNYWEIKCVHAGA